VGSHNVYDPETGAATTVDDYAWVEVSYSVYAMNVRRSVSYEIKEAKLGMALESDGFEAIYSQDYPTSGVILDAV
jgi:hypothetical protein